MDVSCHSLFCLVLLLNQLWSPPITLQASLIIVIIIIIIIIIIIYKHIESQSQMNSVRLTHNTG